MIKAGLILVVVIVSLGYISYNSANSYFTAQAVSEGLAFSTAESFLTPIPTGEPSLIPEECSHIEFFGDPILGTELDDEINGTPNNDLILVFGGDDEVKGGAGNDCIVATGGFNLIDGDSGNDVIITGDGDDEVFGGSGDDIVFSSGGSDFIYGGSGDDTLIGGSGEDTIDGGTGKDTCEGEELRRCEE